MADPDRARAVLTALTGLGVRVSVDDFGTGYSSLAHLRRFPVHALKVDRSFLGVGPAPAAARQRDAVIIRTIVEMGHALALTVVAEGVEDQETVEFLRDLGCDRAQGYHIGKPMPVEQILRWLVESPWGRRTSRGPARA